MLMFSITLIRQLRAFKEQKTKEQNGSSDHKFSPVVAHPRTLRTVMIYNPALTSLPEKGGFPNDFWVLLKLSSSSRLGEVSPPCYLLGCSLGI